MRILCSAAVNSMILSSSRLASPLLRISSITPRVITQTALCLRPSMRLSQLSTKQSVSVVIQNTTAPTIALIGFSLGSGARSTSATKHYAAPSRILVQNCSLQLRGNHSLCNAFSYSMSTAWYLRMMGQGKGEWAMWRWKSQCTCVRRGGVLSGGKAEDSMAFMIME